jgi:hypothetical protein
MIFVLAINEAEDDAHDEKNNWGENARFRSNGAAGKPGRAIETGIE